MWHYKILRIVNWVGYEGKWSWCILKHCSGIKLQNLDTSHTVSYSRTVPADTTEVILKSCSVRLHILCVRLGQNQFAL